MTRKSIAILPSAVTRFVSRNNMVENKLAGQLNILHSRGLPRYRSQ